MFSLCIVIDMDRPFSPRLIELYRQFQDAPKDQRLKLAREIAETFASERDCLDHSGSEDYHEFFEDFETARLAFDQQSQKLTRITLQLVEHYMEHHPEAVQDVPTSTRAN